MAGDITSTIRFIADASQAIGTMRALAAEATALNQSVTRIQSNLAAQQAGGLNVSRGQFSQIKSAQNPAFANQVFNLPSTNTIDQYNKTLRATHDAVVLNAQGQEIYRATLSNTTGDIREIESALGRYGRVTSIVSTEQQNLSRSLAEAQSSYRNIRQSILDTTVAERQRQGESINGLNQQLQQLRNLRSQQQAQRVEEEARARQLSLFNNSYSKKQSDRRLSNIDSSILATDAQIAAAEFDRAVLLAQKRGQPSVNEVLENDPLLRAAKQRVTELQKLIPTTNAASLDLIRRAQAGIDSAVNLPSPLPASLETVRKESPALFNRLANQGLLGPQKGVVDIKSIYESGASDLQLTRDLERGTTSLRGSVRGLNGELININAAYAEGGRVIGRYGGTLSGIQNFLRQTVNNFQKVVQWGVATTAVFAGLGLATSSIDTIKTLDASLNQLSITAELTAKQTSQVFDDLANIAFDTSTPLEEMVKAADDIALATKRANQSTVEWQGNIKSLATSVGILTNITGLDTVRATDLLTSTMKQLNIQAQDIPTILNKVSAVAGGQANSITDVVSGLGAMAEAAQQANLSIDQTIGVVQVLGQVTSKSSSEIATAFKNLVGSVDSVGAQKAFDKYNISIKDSEGNLRNILDIYDEINQKIKSGVIPESDVKALVKAIAGGPRRAPDAAALLANVDAIKEATDRASQATNEAFIANAKYLNTIESKITQIQVKFSTFIQKTFGPALKGFVTDVANVLNGVLTALSGLDPEVIKTILGFATLLISIKAITGVMKFFGGAISDVLAGLRVFVSGVNAAAAAGTASFRLTGSTANLASAEMVAASQREIAALDDLIAAHAQNAAAARASGNAELAASEEIALAAANNRRSAAVGAGITPLGAAPITPVTGLGRLRGLAGPLAGGAVGAGLTAATGGSGGQILGGGLLGTGLSLLASPIPIPYLKLLAGALIGVGGALTLFTGENKKAEESTKDLSEQVLASINQYKEAQDSVKLLTGAQTDAKAQFESISNQYKSGKASLTALNSTVVEYAKATYDLQNANKALEQSFEDLSRSGSKLDTNFGQEIKAAKAGTLSPEAIKALQKKIYEELFKEVYPDLSKTASQAVPFSLISPITATGTQASYSDTLLQANGRFAKATPQTFNVDLKNLTEASDILKLFNKDATQLTGTFDHSAEAIDLINTYLGQTVEQGGELGDRAKVAQQTFTQIVAQFDVLSQADLFAKQQDALIQTKQILGQINGEEVKQAQSLLSVYQKLIGIAATLPSGADSVRENNRLPGGVTPLSTNSSEGLQQLARELLIDKEGNVRTGGVEVSEARRLIDALGLTKGLKEDIKLTDQQVADIAENILGISVKGVSVTQQQKAASEELLAIQQNLEDIQSKALDTLASKSADIQRRFLSGDITRKMRDSLLAGAKATNQLDNQIVSLLTKLSENNGALVQFEDTLAKIPGLENLTGKNADEAASLMIELFDSMDLTSKGANSLINKIVALIASINAIPKDTLINIRINTQYSSRQDFIGTEGNDPDSRGKANAAFTDATDTAAQQYKNYQKQLQDLMNQIRKILGGGLPGSTFLGGSGSGSGSGKTATPPDISELDLPDEIANASNRQALIQEAIKRARALQHLIPGADKEAKNDIVELLKGTQRILEVRGVKDEYLRRALEELADVEKKRLEFETKADTIRRIRVGAGDFAAIANVPLNSQTGVSLGGAQGPINVTLNINGTILTPAQLSQFADLVGAALKRQIANG